MRPDSLFDTHAHLDDERFGRDLIAVLDRARDAGVARILTAGTTVASSRIAAALAGAYPGFLYAAVGVSPHDAQDVSDDDIRRLRDLADCDSVVAVGETGLDYHYEHCPRQQQKQSFRSHIELALNTNLPLVVHCREAFVDCLAVLREYAGASLRGVAHCFSGTSGDAAEFIELGFYISFAGVLTFRNADDLRRLAGELPLDRILVETDSPYLAPHPKRGKRNEPAFVTYVAARLAEIRCLDAETMARALTANASRLFGLA